MGCGLYYQQCNVLCARDGVHSGGGVLVDQDIGSLEMASHLVASLWREVLRLRRHSREPPQSSYLRGVGHRRLEWQPVPECQHGREEAAPFISSGPACQDAEPPEMLGADQLQCGSLHLVAVLTSGRVRNAVLDGSILVAVLIAGSQQGASGRSRLG